MFSMITNEMCFTSFDLNHEQHIKGGDRKRMGKKSWGFDETKILAKMWAETCLF